MSKKTTNEMTVEKYLRDGGIAKFHFGKIAYTNPNRKANATDVEFGLRKLSGNKESYFSVTGGVWNTRHTDYDTCGCSVHEKIQHYVNDPLLGEMIDLGKKWHLTNRSKLPKKVMKRIIEIIEMSGTKMELSV